MRPGARARGAGAAKIRRAQALRNHVWCLIYIKNHLVFGYKLFNRIHYSGNDRLDGVPNCSNYSLNNRQYRLDDSLVDIEVGGDDSFYHIEHGLKNSLYGVPDRFKESLYGIKDRLYRGCDRRPSTREEGADAVHSRLEDSLDGLPDSGEEALDICEILIKSGEVNLVILDSVEVLAFIVLKSLELIAKLITSNLWFSFTI